LNLAVDCDAPPHTPRGVTPAVGSRSSGVARSGGGRQSAVGTVPAPGVGHAGHGLAAVATVTKRAVSKPEDLEFFESKVRPLLVARCAECHSRATSDPEGGLSCDSRADFPAAAGVAVTGSPDDTLIVKVVC
jgi:hypothetical protein